MNHNSLSLVAEKTKTGSELAIELTDLQHNRLSEYYADVGGLTEAQNRQAQMSDILKETVEGEFGEKCYVVDGSGGSVDLHSVDEITSSGDFETPNLVSTRGRIVNLTDAVGRRRTIEEPDNESAQKLANELSGAGGLFTLVPESALGDRRNQTLVVDRMPHLDKFDSNKVYTSIGNNAVTIRNSSIDSYPSSDVPTLRINGRIATENDWQNGSDGCRNNL
ncbi:hypothetical protein KA043_03045 [Candidatus Saccharibacteria bacterium]|nr:hypothetical protein [Candidatus Saccharibacteria bacterium]